MAGEKTVVVGFGHNMVIKQDNSVWATGWNLYGQFGDGSINSASTFIRVAKLSDRMVDDEDILTRKGFPHTTLATSLTGKTFFVSSLHNFVYLRCTVLHFSHRAAVCFHYSNQYDEVSTISPPFVCVLVSAFCLSEYSIFCYLQFHAIVLNLIAISHLLV